MWIVTNPTDNKTHAVRNRRTAMILGLECGKPAGLSKVTPVEDGQHGDITCTKCAERTALVAG